MLRLALAQLASVLVLAACGSGGAGNAAIDGGAGSAGSVGPGGFGGFGGGVASGGSTASDATSAGGSGAGASSAPCDKYISCVAETTPAGLAPVLAAYGKDGSCWAQGNASLCDQACVSGIVSTHQTYPEVDVCNFCSSSTDCPSSLPGCDPTTQKCVTCTSDAHCSEPSKPHCSSEQQCVQCNSNGDCAQLFGEPICDPALHQCRGCTSNSECGSGACVSSTCVECSTDAQCGGAKPHCGESGLCTQCTNDSQCGKGKCVFGGCCGSTACADQGAQCGLAIDLSNPLCLFSPVSCGSCSSGNTCVLSKCKPTPVNNCVPASCPSKQCGYVPANNAYECIASFGSCSKASQSCGTGYVCVEKKSSVSGEYYYACERYCLKDADCTNATHCAFISGPGSVGRCE